MANEPSPDATPVSTQFQSAHVESLRVAMETLDVNDEQAKVKAEIESSKVHWSELASAYYTAVEGPDMASSSPVLPKWVNKEGTPEWKLEVAEDNVRVFRSLQEKHPGGFFVDENDLEPDATQRLPKWMFYNDGTPRLLEFRLSSETPFAEGGQAELFYAHSIYLEKGGKHEGEKYELFVMKVFKEGTPLRDLLKLFPSTMLTNDETCIEGVFGDKLIHCNVIGGARLLKSTRRFAFLMGRAWEDLRKLINERMLHFNTQCPFPDNLVFHIIHMIAKGMMKLHERDIIHRDLKAPNVLVAGEGFGHILDPYNLQPYQLYCWVADFECSVGIVGTRFWRAPEILEAVKNRSIFLKSELFTKQADVYNFGMICYEILTGGMPFEELGANDFEAVIGGTRPILPTQTTPWLADLVIRCWHKDPSMRPTFKEIVKVLKPYVLKLAKRK